MECFSDKNTEFSKQKNICDEDALLMQNAASGSDHAFRMLVEKWKNALINFFYRSTSNAATSEDLAQLTFINLYRARENYQAKAKFSTYLFQIARNILINEYRQSSRRPQSAELETDFADDRNSDMGTSELEEIFELAIADMPENQRTAILLLKQQGFTYDEIAKTMNASVGAVKTWIFRARATLRSALKERKA